MFLGLLSDKAELEAVEGIEINLILPRVAESEIVTPPATLPVPVIRLSLF